MAIRDWLKKTLRRNDGYDPEGKSKNDGTEHAARKSIRQNVLADPFSDATRRTRRSLLAVSVASLLVNAGHRFGLIQYFGKNPPTTEDLDVFLSLLSVGVAYFLVVFVVSTGHEISRWRHAGNLDVLASSLNWMKEINDRCWTVSQHIDREISNQESNNLTKLAKEANKELPDVNTRIRRTANYYITTSRWQLVRMVLLDVALPFSVSVLALYKVAPRIWDTIWRIATA